MHYKHLKSALKAKTELYKHYKELFEVVVKEHKFEGLQAIYLDSVLDEILELCKKGVKPALLGMIIENAKEKRTLDKLVHSSLIRKPEEKTEEYESWTFSFQGKSLGKLNLDE